MTPAEYAKALRAKFKARIKELVEAPLPKEKKVRKGRQCTCPQTRGQEMLLADYLRQRREWIEEGMPGLVELEPELWQAKVGRFTIIVLREPVPKKPGKYAVRIFCPGVNTPHREQCPKFNTLRNAAFVVGRSMISSPYGDEESSKGVAQHGK